MSTDILAAIDGAIDDWETSGDAMRWTPDVAPNLQPTGASLTDLSGRPFSDVIHDWRRRLLTEVLRRLAEECDFNGIEIQQVVDLVAREFAVGLPVRLAQPLPQPQRQDDRPAYVSPHGPPPRRRPR